MLSNSVSLRLSSCFCAVVPCIEEPTAIPSMEPVIPIEPEFPSFEPSNPQFIFYDEA